MINNLQIDDNTKAIGKIVKERILKQMMIEREVLIPELAQKVGFSITTVKKYVLEMIESGVVVELGKKETNKAGRQAIRYGVKGDSFFFLGVDVKAFELIICLMDFVGEVVTIEHFTDFCFANTHETLDYICKTTSHFIDNLDGIDPSKIIRVNINISGRVNSKVGTSASLFKFEEMQDTTLAEVFSERLGKSVSIENDTKAMAYGEYLFSENKKYSNLLFVNVSWGIGLGIIIDGKIYSGKDGYSGEFGHMNLYDNNVLCHCGKKGCIETEISGRAIHRKIIERISAGETSALSPKVEKGETITTEDIISAAEKEDPLCIEIIEQTAIELGRHLAALMNLFNPEAIIIGGTLAQANKDYFLRPIDLAIKKYSLRLMCRNVPIVTSSLLKDAGAIGACLIARQKQLTM